MPRINRIFLIFFFIFLFIHRGATQIEFISKFNGIDANVTQEIAQINPMQVLGTLFEGLFKSFSKLASTDEQNDVINGTGNGTDGGNLQCKPGVGGESCDRCLSGFYGLEETGCKPCVCDLAGSVDGKPRCEPESGKCECKAHVDGERCDRCKPGFIGLSSENPLGCSPCLCNGQKCSPIDGYYAVNMTSKFDNGKDAWRATFADEPVVDDLVVRWVKEEEAIAVHSVPNGMPVYFLAAEKFTGNLLPSYNQWISFKFRVSKEAAKTGPHDILIVGANGKNISFPLISQKNPKPTTKFQEYRFHLHYAKVDEAFLPLHTIASGFLSALKPILHVAGKMKNFPPQIPLDATNFAKEFDFLRVLQNVESIKIRGTYSDGDIGYLSDFSLGSASTAEPLPNAAFGRKVDWIGQCECQENTAGEFCDSCVGGYRKIAKNHVIECVKCECNGHSETCHPENGDCTDCQGGSTGKRCDRCGPGFFGNPLMINGTRNECQKCPCADGVHCVQDLDQKPICVTEEK